MLTSRRISLAFTEVICKPDFRERGDSQKISFHLTLRREVSFWTSHTDSGNKPPKTYRGDYNRVSKIAYFLNKMNDLDT